MMKSIKRLLTAAFTAALCLTVFAGTFCVISADKAYAADDEEYKFRVEINSGKEGDFTSGKISSTGLVVNYGDKVTVDVDGNISINEKEIVNSKLTVKDPDTYTARGIKLTGHDNDETDKMGYATSYTFTATKDESFSVAYALKGSMVKYVVNYEDEARNPLRPSKTYYGMIGDYPVVSYQVVDGYLPDAYNKGKTLVADESENVFTFVYSQNANGGTETQTVIVNDGNTNTGNATGGTPAGGAGQPADFVDLDDGNVPLAPGGGDNNGGNGGNNGGQTDIPDDNTPTGIQSGKILPFILGGGLLAALIALIAFLRARGRDDDEEVADELEDMYINSDDGMDKLSQADPEKFKTGDPDELKEAFKELDKK